MEPDLAEGGEQALLEDLLELRDGPVLEQAEQAEATGATEWEEELIMQPDLHSPASDWEMVEFI